MSSIRIVEYNESYAAALAEMWNRSGESWGGSQSNRTAEVVAEELRNSINLHNDLAVDGDEVVGFCSFSHYRNDEGSLYIPLLNVRPDYHGRKVGKELVLHAVRRTIEMGWPRLDLFTWAGNTKAVPLYKKCGFFWEKKEDAVHLMNFIPTVLSTEALKAYFERIDWYADSTREIAIEPDGRKENGFDIFEYCWEKDGERLRVEFEKSGRGLRAIETDDYLIVTELERHGFVFGSGYSVRYVVRNKSGKPLEVSVSGKDDKNIRFAMNRTLNVDDSAVLEGLFFVDPVEEEQSDWRTHPCVVSEWKINGLAATLRTGIAPKAPAKIAMAVKAQETLLNAADECYVTIENNYPEPATFKLTLPSSEGIRFEGGEVEAQLPAQGRETVALPYTLSGFGMYAADVMVQAKPEHGEQVEFRRNVHGIFQGRSGRYGGRAGENWVAVNGPYSLTLNGNNNDLTPHRYNERIGTWWMFPKLAHPISAEFSRKKADHVRIYEEGEIIVLEAEYSSDDFPDIKLRSFAKLSIDGMIEHFFEVENAGVSTSAQEVTLLEGFYHELSRAVLPYAGDYIELKEEHARDLGRWAPEKLSENWLFSYDDRYQCRGFSWDATQRLVKSEWHLGLEHRFGRLESGQIVRTKPTVLAAGTYSSWRDFRAYVLRRRAFFRRPSIPSSLS